MTPRRVAIAGAGPKGLFALERLLHHCAMDGGPELDIHLFDPDPDPGAGAVYRPSQPDYLVMNQPAGHVDMWWPGQGVVPIAQRLPFAAWAGRDAGEYAPRAEVGRYLQAGLNLLLRHAPAAARVEFHREAVSDVEPAPGGWQVHTDAGAEVYDELLLATGHEPATPAGAVPVFPVEGLSQQAVPDGSTVAIRGFALSFIDAALALTQGRGGRFVSGDRPHLLRYLPGPGAPVGLRPFSRTGRPILPKPEARVADVPGLDRVDQRGRERLDAAVRPCSIEEHILPALAATATASLDLAGAEADHGGWAGVWLARAAAGEPISGGGDPRSRLEHALDVAVGAATPDRDWALGHAWRALYPAIVRATGTGALDPVDRPAFLRLAAQMERIAFGPAPGNTAKLLALVDAGVVQLADGPPEHADVVVDAVLAPPGVPASGPLRRLVDAGHASEVPGGRGLRVDARGTCIASGGGASTGLAAYGRPTEDGVVGNDTLSRTLHPFIDLWAARVAGPEPVAMPPRDLAVRA